jgi:arsenate reductase
MAEALAWHLASDVMRPASAGISPLGRIVEPTRAVLRERGISTDGQFSKGLREMDPDVFELIVNMTGMPGHSVFPGAQVLDWDIDDPYGEDLGMYRRVCDDIEELVKQLAADLRAQAARRGKAGSAG